MARGRPTRFIKSEIEIRQYFLDHLVDADGNKVSLRTIWWSEDFINFSGMTGERKGKRSSEGTMSYWVYKKWGLNDEYVYNYHKNVTYRIKSEMTFEEWIASCNYGKNKEKFSIDMYNENLVKKIINILLERLELKYRLNEHSPIKPYWVMLQEDKKYRYKKLLLIKDFKTVYEELKGGGTSG